MVYCGKPSKACQECRLRRTKCDERIPSCGQCFRTQRDCSGYRDPRSLIFRDQTEAVKRKGKAQAIIARYNREQLLQIDPVHPIFFTLQPSVEDRATALFASHYIVGKSRSFEYIDVFYTTPVMDDHLSAAIRAVSLADLAEELCSDELLRKARKQYIYSLRATNLGLRDDVMVTKDSTLLAVLLLDLFEKITARHNQRPLADLTEHIAGATKLIILRGSDQFCSEAGVRMFNHLLYMIIISSTINRVNMPPAILALLNPVTDGHYQWRQVDCMIRYVELRADVHSGRLADPEEIMSLGKKLDDDTTALAQSMEDMWPYNICFTDDTTSAYGGVYHMYDINFHQLKVWNSVRVGRIVVNAIVQEAYMDGLRSSPASFPNPITVAQFEASLDATMDVALELCCAVPQYCMCLPQSHTEFPHENSLTDSESHSLNSSPPENVNEPRKFTPQEEASAYTMIHPLHIALRSSAGRDKNLRAWILARLTFIGNVIGLPNALMVVDTVERGSGADPWIVFAQLAGHNAPVNPFDPPTSMLGNRSRVGDGRSERQEYLMLV